MKADLRVIGVLLVVLFVCIVQLWRNSGPDMTAYHRAVTGIDTSVAEGLTVGCEHANHTQVLICVFQQLRYDQGQFSADLSHPAYAPFLTPDKSIHLDCRPAGGIVYTVTHAVDITPVSSTELTIITHRLYPRNFAHLLIDHAVEFYDFARRVFTGKDPHFIHASWQFMFLDDFVGNGPNNIEDHWRSLSALPPLYHSTIDQPTVFPIAVMGVMCRHNFDARAINNFATYFFATSVAYMPAFRSDRVLLQNREGSRHIVNEADVSRELQESGYPHTVIHPGTHSLVQQAVMMQTARVIIAPHGSNLATLLFAHSNLTIIEAFADHLFTSYFLDICKIMGIRYFTAHRTPKQHKPGNADDEVIHVDAGELLSTMRQADNASYVPIRLVVDGAVAYV